MLRQRNIVHRDLKPQVLPKDILIWSLSVGLGVISPLFLVFIRFFFADYPDWYLGCLFCAQSAKLRLTL